MDRDKSGKTFLVAVILSSALMGTSALNRAQAAEKKKSKPVSVYAVEPVRDGIILGTSTAVSLWPALNGYHFIHIQPVKVPENLNTWDRNYIQFRNVFLDNVSDATVVIAVAAPAILDLVDVGWTHVFYEDMFVYAETMMINTTLSAFFKYTSQRPIPRVYQGDPAVANSARGYEGFYSGHVATSMAALTATALTIQLRHDAGFWPWLIPIVVGASVAIERVQAGEHFPTQVLAGAVMGPIVGFTVPYLHRLEEEKKIGIGLQPSADRDGGELTVTRHF